MKTVLQKGLILLWLSWYFSGPIVETIDTWESPQNEMQDVIFNAAGALTLIALAVLCRRSLHQVFRYLALTFLLASYQMQLSLSSVFRARHTSSIALQLGLSSLPPPLRI
jgi:hypothetical protein